MTTVGRAPDLALSELSTDINNHRYCRLTDGGDTEALNPVWDRWLVLDTIVRFYPSVATNLAPLDAISAQFSLAFSIGRSSTAPTRQDSVAPVTALLGVDARRDY